MRVKNLLPFLGCLVLASCTVTNPVAPPPPPALVAPPSLSDIPVKPTLVPYPVPPVIRKVDGNYLVREELITNATLLTDYYKRIEEWKKVKKFQ